MASSAATHSRGIGSGGGRAARVLAPLPPGVGRRNAAMQSDVGATLTTVAAQSEERSSCRGSGSYNDLNGVAASGSVVAQQEQQSPAGNLPRARVAMKHRVVAGAQRHPAAAAGQTATAPAGTAAPSSLTCAASHNQRHGSAAIVSKEAAAARRLATKPNAKTVSVLRRVLQRETTPGPCAQVVRYLSGSRSSAVIPGSTCTRLYVSVPPRLQFSMSALLERTPRADSVVFLGFTRSGSHVLSYSFDAQLRFELQIWSFTIGGRAPLRLHASVPLFADANFAAVSEMGLLVDGTHVRVQVWQPPDDGCLVVFGFLHERLRLPQPYHVTILPAPFAVASPTVPQASHATAPGVSGLATINSLHVALLVAAPYPRPSIVGFEQVFVGGSGHTSSRTYLLVLNTGDGLHVVTFTSRPVAALPPVSEPAPQGVARSPKDPSILPALGKRHNDASVQREHGASAALTAGVPGGLQVPTATLPHAHAPTPWFNPDAEFLYHKAALVEPAAAAAFAAAIVSTPLPFEQLVTPSSAVAALVASVDRVWGTDNAELQLAAGVLPDRVALLHRAAQPVSNDRPAAGVRPFAGSSSPVACDPMQNRRDARSFMGSVQVQSHAAIDVEPLLARCIRGRVRNYDVRLVAVLDTAAATERNALPASSRVSNPAAPACGGSAAARIGGSLPAGDARILLLCILVDHELDDQHVAAAFPAAVPTSEAAGACVVRPALSAAAVSAPALARRATTYGGRGRDSQRDAGEFLPAHAAVRRALRAGVTAPSQAEGEGEGGGRGVLPADSRRTIDAGESAASCAGTQAKVPAADVDVDGRAPSCGGRVAVAAGVASAGPFAPAATGSANVGGGDSTGSFTSASRSDADEWAAVAQEAAAPSTRSASSQAFDFKDDNDDDVDEEARPAKALVADTPLVRSKLVCGLDRVTGAAKVVSLAKLPPGVQPAFDGCGSQARTLSQLTSGVVNQLRQALQTPVAPHFVVRELTNDAVLAGKSLRQLVNPYLPVAFVNDA